MERGDFQFYGSQSSIGVFDEANNNNVQTIDDLVLLKNKLDNLQEQNIALKNEVKSLKESVDDVRHEKRILTKEHLNCKGAINEFKLQMVENDQVNLQKMYKLKFDLNEKNIIIEKLISELKFFKAKAIEISILKDKIKLTEYVIKQARELNISLNLDSTKCKELLGQMSPTSEINLKRKQEKQMQVYAEISKAEKFIESNRLKLQENLGKLKFELLQRSDIFRDGGKIQKLNNKHLQMKQKKLFNTKYRYIIIPFAVLVFDFMLIYYGKKSIKDITEGY